MTVNTQDEFDRAGTNRFNTEVKFTEFLGELLLITPTEYIEDFETSFGTKDPVVADVVVLSHKGTPEHKDVLIFQGSVIGALKPRIVTKRKMLGVLAKGEAKKGQAAPYVLDPPTDEQAQIARDYLAGRTVEAAVAPVDDPFAVKK